MTTTLDPKLLGLLDERDQQLATNFHDVHQAHAGYAIIDPPDDRWAICTTGAHHPHTCWLNLLRLQPGGEGRVDYRAEVGSWATGDVDLGGLTMTPTQYTAVQQWVSEHQLEGHHVQGLIGRMLHCSCEARLDVFPMPEGAEAGYEPGVLTIPAAFPLSFQDVRDGDEPVLQADVIRPRDEVLETLQKAIDVKMVTDPAGIVEWLSDRGYEISTVWDRTEPAEDGCAVEAEPSPWMHQEARREVLGLACDLVKAGHLNTDQVVAKAVELEGYLTGKATTVLPSGGALIALSVLDQVHALRSRFDEDLAASIELAHAQAHRDDF